MLHTRLYRPVVPPWHGRPVKPSDVARARSVLQHSPVVWWSEALAIKTLELSSQPVIMQKCPIWQAFVPPTRATSHASRRRIAVERPL